MHNENNIIENKVKCDIILVLDKLINKLEHKDLTDANEITDEVIHCASIFQDEDSISIAVIGYALFKILERENNIDPQFIHYLKEAREKLGGNKIKQFHFLIKRLTATIAKKDKKLHMYIRHVLNEAEIKKGSKIYEQGISLAQTAKLLNISQWELMKYIGKTTIVDIIPEKIEIKKRILFTRNLIANNNLNNTNNNATHINKTIVFDSGPIISLSINNLLWILEPLKEKFKGNFLITPSVYKEIIEQPLSTRKYKLEALQVMPFISKGILTIEEDKNIKNYAEFLLELINTCFKAYNNYITLVHYAEMEVISCAKIKQAKAIVIDERTTRKLIEDPEGHIRYLEYKLATKITIDTEKFILIKKELSGINVIRSIELATIAFENNLFNKYIDKNIPITNVRKAILEGVLWGIKLNGCSVKEDEINAIVALDT